jgi:hypothetical protein
MIEGDIQKFVIAFVANLVPLRTALLGSWVITFSGADTLHTIPYSAELALYRLMGLIVVLCAALWAFGRFERHAIGVCEFIENG